MRTITSNQLTSGDTKTRGPVRSWLLVLLRSSRSRPSLKKPELLAPAASDCACGWTLDEGIKARKPSSSAVLPRIIIAGGTQQEHDPLAAIPSHLDCRAALILIVAPHTTQLPGSLPAPGCGIASRPRRAIGAAGLAPAELQPCRLLPLSGTPSLRVLAFKATDPAHWRKDSPRAADPRLNSRRRSP